MAGRGRVRGHSGVPRTGVTSSFYQLDTGWSCGEEWAADTAPARG